MRKLSTAVVVCCLTFSVLLGLAFSQAPEQFESLLASAQQAQARSDFQSAAEFYRQALSLHPEIAELRANLGLMYYQTGKDEKAIGAFREAIRLKPALFVPNLFLGLEYVKLKRFNEAIPYLKRAVQLKPTDAQAQLGLGQAYAGIGNTRLAIRCYLRANEIDPQNADTWYHLGVLYLEQVEANARVLLTRHKDSGYVQALIADTFAEQRAFIQSADAYKKALSLSSFPPDTQANYGFVLVSRHDLPSAQQAFNAELASNPGSLMAKLGLARVHLERGELEESVKEIVRVFEADPGFLASDASRFSAGLAPEKRAELDHALEQHQRARETPEELLALFRNVPPEQRAKPLHPRTSSCSPVAHTQPAITRMRLPRQPNWRLTWQPNPRVCTGRRNRRRSLGLRLWPARAGWIPAHPSFTSCWGTSTASARISLMPNKSIERHSRFGPKTRALYSACRWLCWRTVKLMRRFARHRRHSKRIPPIRN